MKRMLALASAFLVMAACYPQPASPVVEAPAIPAVDTARVADEVKTAIAVQVRAYADRDLDAMLSVMAPDYVWIAYGQPNLSGDAVRAGVAAQFADPALALTVTDETVDVAQAGDMAVYHSTYTYTYTDAATNAPTTENGNWVGVFKRQPNGSMKLARDIIVGLPAAAK